jgi:hypothetical protein
MFSVSSERSYPVTQLRGNGAEPPRQLPNNQVFEQRLLGTILCDNKAYRQVVNIVRREHFWSPVH